MFETGIRQLRLAMSMVWGRRIDPDNLARLVEDALATMAEFGRPGEDVEQLVDGPFADEGARRDLTERALRRTARRLSKLSPFYAQRFAAAGIDPRRLTAESMREIPMTVKADLVATPRDFLCAGSSPVISTRSTGSTGKPVEVWLSQYEANLYPALAAISGVLRGELGPHVRMQICVSSRATAAVQHDVGACAIAGARADVIGMVPPDEALDLLMDGPTFLATYPSYLAVMVKAAQRRGLTAKDFPLVNRIDVGGEIVSQAVVEAAKDTFGVSRVNDAFGMTEVLPVSGRTCNLGHLHHDLNIGYVEVLSLKTGEPAGPGELGTVVITPYYPYRECMPVFRYNTKDLVRALPEGPAGCELSGTPGTSAILGKQEGLLAGTQVTTRDLVEALESLPTQPWPVRYRAEHTKGKTVLTVGESTVAGLGVAAVTTHLADRGLKARINVVDDDEARALRPVRADLLETTFTARAL